MKKWQRKAKENGWSQFPYQDYTNVYSPAFVKHKISKASAFDPLYSHGMTPDGRVILWTLEEWDKLNPNSDYIPIAIQQTDPDAPLTSELAERFK